MPQVSKRVLQKDIEVRIYDLFWKSMASCSQAEKMEQFMHDLLSPIERTMLAKRLGIAVMLAKGFTYEEIKETLKVSQTTIAKVAYFLNHGDQGYQKIVQSILRKEHTEQLVDAIGTLLIKAAGPARIGSAKYLLKQSAGKKLYQRKKFRSIL